jgi:hypothetical protein
MTTFEPSPDTSFDKRMTMTGHEYGEFLAREYLDTFVADGGAAVKVAVCESTESASSLATTTMDAARARGYAAVTVDARSTRVSLIQQLFFAIAAEIEWGTVAQEVLKGVLKNRLGSDVSDWATLETISQATGLDPPTVRTEMLKGLEDAVYRNYSLSKDFRLAMLSYCLAQLDADARGERTREVLGDWLCGELRLVGAVKEFAIFQKIGRHNARVQMSSTAEWLRQAGHPGLFVILDIQQLAVANRRDTSETAYFYTLANVMDAYEVLRQFIDATDEMSGIMLLIIAPAALLDEERRGFQAYPALRNRIWDDVRDRRRSNPFAPMVRIAPERGK